MAKKKAIRTKAKPVQERRSIAVAIKGNEEWKAWLEMVAKRCRTTVSALIDQALTEYAKSKGIVEEPPDR
jgi:hypothetical protein